MDIRDMIQMEADELAFKLYEADFNDLAPDLQRELYSRAMHRMSEEAMDLGSNELKRRREIGQ
jgi:hypothetical protein